MPDLLAKVVTFILSLFVGALALLLLPLGLIAPLFILFPLLLGMIALLSSLSASWLSALFVSRWGYSRLLPVVGFAEATAAAAALIVVLWIRLVGGLPISILFAAATLIIVVSANVATWRYRSAERVLVKDILVTVGMIALGILVCVGAYLLGMLFGVIGP